MNRNFYFYGNLFLGLGGAASLLQSILYILLGASLFYLNSFLWWFALGTVMWLAGAAFVLKYFHCKAYRFAFVSGVTAVIANMSVVILLFSSLVSAQQQNPFYIWALAFLLSALVLYGISLIFSAAGKNLWLRISGILILVAVLPLGAGLLWGMVDPEILMSGTLEKIDRWGSLLHSVIPFLFIMQFNVESNSFKKQDYPPVMRTSESIFGFIGILAFVCTIILGVIIATQGFTSLHWKAHNAERANELANKSEQRTFVNNAGTSLQYLLLKPLDYDALTKYPLVVCLPYGEYEAPMAQLLSDAANRRLYPAFIFVPYNPKGSTWGGIPGRPAKDSLVYETLRSLDDAAIDKKRIYVSGVSLGGYGSWHFISSRPEMFAAAVPVCGEGDPSFAEEIVDVPVWAFHGAKDRNVPVSGSRDMIEAIRKAGGNPRYTEFPDAAHGIWHEVTETPGMLDWLFEQRKE